MLMLKTRKCFPRAKIMKSELHHLLNSELWVAVDWFRNNGMLTNPDKFQSMILGTTSLDFTFVIDGIKTGRRDNIDWYGINTVQGLVLIGTKPIYVGN